MIPILNRFGNLLILKFYARIFSNNAEKSLELLKLLPPGVPHLRFRFNEWDLIGIGDILIVGGSDKALASIRGSFGPLIVEDLAETQRILEQSGVEITLPATIVPTGIMLYAKHPDGSIVEYVQWTPELIEQLIRRPQSAGRLSSHL